MPTRESRFAIVFVDDGSAECGRVIQDNLAFLGARSSSLQYETIRLSGSVRGIESCLKELGEPFDRIILVEANSILSSGNRLLTEVTGDHSGAVSWFHRLSPQSGLVNGICQFFYATASRYLLRTGKNEFNGGGVTVPGSLPAELLRESIYCSSIAELVAGCRLAGLKVDEICIETPFAEVSKSSLKATATACRSMLRFWWQNIAFPRAIEKTMPVTPAFRQAGYLWGVVLLFLAAIVILFSGLGYPLFEPDEARNAQLAMNILETGDWLSLSLDNEPYWDKPPLQAWMTAASYSIFGTNEWATRLPCAICSLLTMTTVLFWGGRLMGRKTGLFAAAMLLISTGFVMIARYVTMDATLTFFTTLMTLSTLAGIEGGAVRRFWLVVAGIACGLGILTKGPVILLLVLPPILAYGWLNGEAFYRKPEFWLWPGVPAFLISGPWFLATAIVHPDFIAYFFWKHNVIRFSEAFNHREPFWYYLPVLVLMMYPACFLFPALARVLFSAHRAERQALGRVYPGVLLGALWPVVFFSMSDAKLPTYILPAIPLACLLLGRTVALSDSDFEVQGLRERVAKIPAMLATSAAIMFIPVLLGAGYLRELNGWGLAGLSQAIFLIALMGLMVFLAHHYSARSPAGWLGGLGAAILLLGSGLTMLVPGLAEVKSLHDDVARKTREDGFDETPILYFGVDAHANSLFLDENNPAVALESEEYWQAIQFLTHHPTSILVTSSDNAKSLKRDLSGKIEIQADPLQKKLYSVRMTNTIQHTATTSEVWKHN